MGGLDAPGLGVEVVGTGTDVLDGTEGNATVGDGHDAARGVGGEDERLAPEVAESVGIGEVDGRWYGGTGERGNENTQTLDLPIVISRTSVPPYLRTPELAQGAHEQPLAAGDAGDETIDGDIEAGEEGACDVPRGVGGDGKGLGVVGVQDPTNVFFVLFYIKGTRTIY